MLDKDDGIVLKAQRSGETSLIATVLGRKMGKVRLMAKGVLSERHPARGLLDAGNYLDVLFYNKEGRTLFFMKEASLRAAPAARAGTLAQLATMMGAVELLDQVCFPGSPDAHIVEVASEYLCCPLGGDPLLMFLAFQIKLLAAMGALPEMSSCAACAKQIGSGWFSARDGVSYCDEHQRSDSGAFGVMAEARAVLRSCAAHPFVEIHDLAVAAETRKNLGKVIHWTYTFHVHGYSLPKSLSLI